MGSERKNRSNEILTHDFFKGIADAHGCSTGVVSLSWAVQRGIAVIPKSSSRERIADNIKLVTLTDAEMEAISNWHKKEGSVRLSDSLHELQVEIGGKTTLQGWTNVDFGWVDEKGRWLT